MKALAVNPNSGKHYFNSLSKNEQTRLIIMERVRQDFNETHLGQYYLEAPKTETGKYVRRLVSLEKVIEKIYKKKFKKDVY